MAMFDFGATEMLIIAIVALLVVGPRDLPGLLRQIGQGMATMRRMAAEFQEQFSQAIDTPDIQSLKKDMSEIADQTRLDVGFDPLNEARREMNDAIEGAGPQPTFDEYGPDPDGLVSFPSPERERGRNRQGEAASPAADGSQPGQSQPGQSQTGQSQTGKKPDEPSTTSGDGASAPASQSAAAPARRLPVTTGAAPPAPSTAPSTPGRSGEDGKPTAGES